jgi:hypothetical protein
LLVSPHGKSNFRYHHGKAGGDTALVGVLVGAFVIIPLMTTTTAPPGLDDRARTAAKLLMLIGVQGPGFAILGLLAASPLIAIAVVAGVVFRRSIDRHPLVWSSIAPVLVWLFTCAVIDLQNYSQPWTQLSYFLRMLDTMERIDY